jgi:hypothetical protein
MRPIGFVAGIVAPVDGTFIGIRQCILFVIKISGCIIIIVIVIIILEVVGLVGAVVFEVQIFIVPVAGVVVEPV